MRRRRTTTSRGRSLAGQSLWLKRLLSFFIDLFIINLIIVGPFQSLLIRLMPQQEGFFFTYRQLLENEGMVAFLYAIMSFITLFTLLYFILLEYSIGQTIGKTLLNLKVSGEHGKASFLQCVGRSLFLIPVFPFSILWVVDPLYLALLSPKGQRFSEYITHTYVKASR